MAMCRKSLLLSALLWCFPHAVLASPLMEVMGDMGGESGLTGRYGSPSAASTYFNPALLPQAGTRIQAGIYVFTDQIGVTIDARPDMSSTVALNASGAFARDGDDITPVLPPPVPTAWLEHGCGQDCLNRGAVSSNEMDLAAGARPRQEAGSSDNTRGYMLVGLVNPLVDDYLVMGMSLLMPLSNFMAMRAFYPDEREQYFSNSLHPELYSDRMEISAIAVGLGSQILPNLSVGVSFSLDVAASAVVPTFVPDASAYDQILITVDADIPAGLTPHFGLAFDATDQLQFTAAVHTAQSLDFSGVFRTYLPDGTEQESKLGFEFAYYPWQVSLGGSYRFDLGRKHAVTVVGGADYVAWSEYRDRQGHNPSGDYAWANILVPALGVHYQAGPWNSLLDASYSASPMPEQTGRTSYVDNDRVSLAGALNYTFDIFNMGLRVGLMAQLHRLLPRRHVKDLTGATDDPLVDEVPDNAVTKLDVDEPVDNRDGLQTNNPGFPGYESQGWIYGGGVNLELLF